MSSSASANDDELELRRGRERLSDVAAVEGSAKTHVGRALSGHERMFPCLSTLRKNRSLGLHAFAHAYYGGRPERRRDPFRSARAVGAATGLLAPPPPSHL